MKSLSEEKQFNLKRLYLNKQVPFHVYDSQGQLIYREGIGDSIPDPFLIDAGIRSEIQKRVEERRGPVIYVEENAFAYLAFLDENQNLYIAGPACVAQKEEMNLAMYDYRRRHGISAKYQTMPHRKLTELANLLSIALLCFHLEPVDEGTLFEENRIQKSQEPELERKIEQYFMETADIDREHVKYEYERQQLDDVRNGRVERFDTQDKNEIFLIDKVGKMAVSSEKQMEYMTAGSIILTGRAAIDGGVPAAVAYAVSDLYFQRLEKASDIMEMQNISAQVIREFAALVRKHQNKKSTYVEQCKDIISRNINREISIDDIAKQIGMNRTYLSSRFTKETGMTISGYRIQARLSAAENMLKYSNISIGEIAEYLHFASQSYFGQLFKQQTGMSPAAYRRKYKVLDVDGQG